MCTQGAASPQQCFCSFLVTLFFVPFGTVRAWMNSESSRGCGSPMLLPAQPPCTQHPPSSNTAAPHEPKSQEHQKADAGVVPRAGTPRATSPQGSWALLFLDNRTLTVTLSSSAGVHGLSPPAAGPRLSVQTEPAGRRGEHLTGL